MGVLVVVVDADKMFFVKALAVGCALIRKRHGLCSPDCLLSCKEKLGILLVRYRGFVESVDETARPKVTCIKVLKASRLGRLERLVIVDPVPKTGGRFQGV